MARCWGPPQPFFAGDADTAAFSKRQAGPLANREDDDVAGNDVLGAWSGLQPELPSWGELHEGDIQGFQSGNPALAVIQDPLKRARRVQDDALGLGGFNLPRVSRHLVARFQASHVHFGGAQANCGPGHIDGDVAAAQNHHPLAGKVRRFAQTNIAQEGGVHHDTLQVGAGDGQLHARHGLPRRPARRDSPCWKRSSRLLTRVFSRSSTPRSRMSCTSRSMVEPRQTKLGNANPQHAAGDRQSFKDRHRIAQLAKVLSCRQPARPGANDGDSLRIALGNWRRRNAGKLVRPVGHKSLQSVDIESFVKLVPGYKLSRS